MKRPGKLIALMLFLVSCGTQEKDLYVVRGQIHNVAQVKARLAKVRGRADTPPPWRR